MGEETLWSVVDPSKFATNRSSMALWTEKGEVSYVELAERVLKMERALRHHGARAGIPALIIMTPTVEAIALVLASLKLQIPVFPLGADTPSSAVAAIAVKTKAQLVAWHRPVTSAADFGSESGLSFEGKVLSYSLFSRKPRSNSVLLGKDGQAITFLGKTSGSTADPKILCVGNAAKVRRLLTHIETYELNDRRRILLSTPMQHTLSLRGLFAALATGSCAAILSRYSPEHWRAVAVASRSEFSALVASQLRSIWAAGPPERKHGFALKSLLSSSAPLSSQEKWMLATTAAFDIHECYGTAETATVSSHILAPHGDGFGSVGRVLPGADIKISSNSADDNFEGVPTGEILVRSNCMFDGYLEGDAEVSSALDSNGYFATGDLGKINHVGAVEFRGRVADSINTGGYTISPIAIEEAALSSGFVAEAMALGAPDQVLGEVPVLLVRWKRGGENLRSLRAILRVELDPPALPRTIRGADVIPLTPAGKPDRKRALLNFRAEQDTH